MENMKFIKWLFETNHIPPPPDPSKLLPTKICKTCNISIPITKFCNNRRTYNYLSNENENDKEFRCDCGKLLSYD